MNIIVKPYGSDLCYCRPDTTWERENKDFYVPECAETLFWTPVILARVSKAGKCVGKKFVSRYYDTVGCGILLYIGQDIAFASCADHTSLLPAPSSAPELFDDEDTFFEVMKNGITLSRSEDLQKEDLENAICKASELTTLRIGDFIVSELGPMQILARREDGKQELTAVLSGNEIININILF